MIDLFPNSTIIFQWVIFMVAYLVLGRGVFRPVLSILERRRQLTTETRARSSSLEVEADQLLVECERKLYEARLVGIRERDSRRQTAEQLQAELLKSTRLETGHKIEEVRGVLEQQVRDASLHLRQYAQAIGQEIATKILGKN